MHRILGLGNEPAYPWPFLPWSLAPAPKPFCSVTSSHIQSFYPVPWRAAPLPVQSRRPGSLCSPAPCTAPLPACPPLRVGHNAPLGALSCATCPSPWTSCAYSLPSYFCLPPTLIPFAGIWHLVTAAPPSTPGTATGTY